MDDPAKPPLTIGIVALHALPAVDPACGGAIGGTETRAWTFARGLAAAGHQVRFLVRSNGESFERDTDGVRVVGHRDRWHDRYVRVGRLINREDGRLRLRRWSLDLLTTLPLVAAHRLWTRRRGRSQSFFDASTADCWLTLGVQATSEAVISSAHAADRRCGLLLGCDADVDDWFDHEPERQTPYGDRGRTCAAILRGADGIVTQTEWQRQTLRDRYGRESVVIGNPIDLEHWQPSTAADGTPFVLWVGRAEPVHKRPIEAVTIAAACPEVPFKMVMNAADPATAAAVRAACPANCELIDFVPPDEMPNLMARATLLLNTSSVEGFPNVFLQAAASGTPIVSQQVLGDWLADSGAGRCGDGSVATAAAIVRDLIASAAARDAHAAAGRQYVARHHQLGDRVDELAAFCRNTLLKPAEAADAS